MSPTSTTLRRTGTLAALTLAGVLARRARPPRM